jgi:hypothetical protein
MIQKSWKGKGQPADSQTMDWDTLTMDGDEVEMGRLGDKSRLERSNLPPYIEDD